MWRSDPGALLGLPGAPAPEALAQGALEVLETMFFEIPIGEIETGAPPEAGPASSIAFVGSRRGELAVRLDPPAARRLAASFLGREDDATVTQQEVTLVVLELANMLCGSALSRLDPRGAFQIAAPALAPGAPAQEHAAPPDEPWLVAPLESGRLAVRLTLLESL